MKMEESSPKLKIPEEFESKKEELKRIVMAANALNSKLEKICVYQSYRVRGLKTPFIQKEWLQLDFVTRSTGVDKANLQEKAV